MTIVLVGPHGVGKSAVGRSLAAALSLPFHAELGEELARVRRTPEETAAAPQEEFDADLFELEVARDAAWGESSDRVVESWHPGNLAYAEARSPSLLPRLLRRVQGACVGSRVVVVPLEATLTTLAERQHEPGPLDFFIRVGREAPTWARRLGFTVLPPVSTDGRSVADLTYEIVTQLKHHQEAQ